MKANEDVLFHMTVQLDQLHVTQGFSFNQIISRLDQMPMSLGYTWYDQTPVRLNDALGRRMELPFELCADWTVSCDAWFHFPSSLRSSLEFGIDFRWIP
jgi:hypothetical protein